MRGGNRQQAMPALLIGQREIIKNAGKYHEIFYTTTGFCVLNVRMKLLNSQWLAAGPIRRVTLLCTIAALLLVSCAPQVTRLYEPVSMKQTTTARIRSAGKTCINRIENFVVDDRIAIRNNADTRQCNPGIWYEVESGEYTVEVSYAGFYTHANPAYPYVIYDDKADIRRGPFLRRYGSPIGVNMRSEIPQTIHIQMEPGKEYEVRTRLYNSTPGHFMQPVTPELIAPGDPAVSIIKDLANPDSIVSVVRQPEVTISEFEWQAYVVEVGSGEDEIDKRPENRPLTKAITVGDTEFAKFLVATGEDPMERDREGLTALHQAAAEGRTELVRFLIAKTPDIDVKNNVGMTPLHLAADSGRIEAVQVLVDAHADFNARNDMGATPLFYAAGSGHSNVVQYLLASGADIRKNQKNNWSPLHHAVQGTHPRTVSILLNDSADVNETTDIGLTPLMIAANEESLPIVNMLIQDGAEVTAVDMDGYSAVHYAALRGNLEVIKALVDNGADPCVKSRNGMTALHYASVIGNTTAIAYFLEHGCDVNATTKTGWTPLHMAASTGEFDAVKYLCEHGADINAGIDDHFTPILLARASKDSDCIRYLYENGGRQ